MSIMEIESTAIRVVCDFAYEMYKDQVAVE